MDIKTSQRTCHYRAEILTIQRKISNKQSSIKVEHLHDKVNSLLPSHQHRSGYRLGGHSIVPYQHQQVRKETFTDLCEVRKDNQDTNSTMNTIGNSGGFFFKKHTAKGCLYILTALITVLTCP